jgi:hypothetical protein
LVIAPGVGWKLPALLFNRPGKDYKKMNAEEQLLWKVRDVQSLYSWSIRVGLSIGCLLKRARNNGSRPNRSQYGAWDFICDNLTDC